MNRGRRHLLAATAACALALAGCGSEEEPEGAKLPANAVSELNLRLDEIERRYDDARENDNPGACDDIQSDSFPAVKEVLDGLPQDVDAKLRDATTESFARLQQLTDEGCQDIQEPTETETTPTETVPPETVPPETVPPETTPPETTPPETTPQQTPPDNGSGGTPPRGNGNGNGNGGGQDGGAIAPESDG